MLWAGCGQVSVALMSTQVAFRGQGRGIIDYVLVLCCVNVFYFPLPVLLDSIFIFYRLHRLHQHRELPFYSGPRA